MAQMTRAKSCKVCGNPNHNRRRCNEEKYFASQWHCPICWAWHKRDERKSGSNYFRNNKYHNETLGKHRIFECDSLQTLRNNSVSALLGISNIFHTAIQNGIGVGTIYRTNYRSDEEVFIMLKPDDIIKYIYNADKYGGVYTEDITGQHDLYISYRDLFGYSDIGRTKERMILVDKGSDMSYYPAKFLDRETLRSRASEAYYGVDFIQSKNPLALMDEDSYKLGNYREMHAAFCREYGILDRFNNR